MNRVRTGRIFSPFERALFHNKTRSYITVKETNVPTALSRQCLAKQVGYGFLKSQGPQSQSRCQWI